MPSNNGSRARVRQLARVCAAALLLGACALRAADERAGEVIGNWLTEGGDGIIAISSAADGSYQGKIVGGDNPTQLNDKDPDVSRRTLSVLGLTILQNLKYEGDGKFSGGTVYDPDTGKTYKCNLELLDKDKLKMHGYIGVSLLGRSQTWTRFTGTSLTLPPKAH